MLFSLRKWRPSHLLLSWVAYWAALTAVKLGPAIAAGWRVTRLPTGGSIAASFDNTLLKLSMAENGATVWAGSAPLAIIALWIAGPPILIWAAWLMSRPQRDAYAARDLSSGTAPRAIPGAMPPLGGVGRPGAGDRTAERVRRPGSDSGERLP